MGGFLANNRNPQGQLTLPLEGGCFRVETAHDCHVAVETTHNFRVQLLNVRAKGGVVMNGAMLIKELDCLIWAHCGCAQDAG